MLTDIINGHGFEQLSHFPIREKNTLDLFGQFQDILSPDKLSDYDIVAGTLKVVIPPPHSLILNLQRKSISTVIQIPARYKRTLT